MENHQTQHERRGDGVPPGPAGGPLPDIPDEPTPAGELSEKQIEAATLLSTGMSITDVAKKVDVNRCTIHRWLKDQRFIEERQRLADERFDALRAKALSMAGGALDTLAEVASSAYYPRDAVAAARAICKIAGLEPANRRD